MSPIQVTTVGKLWADTEMFDLDSRCVGDRFRIRVALPASYRAGDKRYPVLYVLDSDGSFGLAVSTMLYMNLGANFGMGKNIPEMIIAGIGYERGLVPWFSTRVRDFTPTEDPTFNYNNPAFNIPESGKAEQFSQGLREDIMPALASHYRIAPAFKVVASHSMSALFALYDLFRPDRLFHKYILASPFVEWGNEALFQQEAAYAEAHQELPAEAFFALASHEPTPTYRENVQKFLRILQQRAYTGFRFRAVEYHPDNHFSVWPKALIDGLISIFHE